MRGQTVLLCGVLGLTTMNSALAAETTPLTDRFAIGVGAYFMTSDTNIRVDEAEDINFGDHFDVEDAFGFDDENVFRAEASWRFAARHKLRLMYFRSDRTARDEIDADLNFGDETFPIQSLVTANLEFEIVELAYQYAFLHGESFEVGASLGLHNVSFTTRLQASVSAGGGTVQDALSETADADAPLPVVGLWGTWRLGSSDFYLQAHAQYFRLEYGDFDGDLQDYQAGLLWQLTRHVGIGASYNLFHTEVDATDEDFAGRLDWKYQGAQVYLRASF